MLHIGITGGIGSGKTTICRIFETLGIPIYYADDRAKSIMNRDPQIRTALISLLGKEAYTGEGDLNRPFISRIVFGNPQKLEALNAIVHPAVGRDAQHWQRQQKHAPYTMREAALLFESGSFRALDLVVMVYAPKELRLQRVMERDQTEKEAVLARMDRQMPDEEKLTLADYVIYNDGSRPLIRQVLELHTIMLQKASTWYQGC